MTLPDGISTIDLLRPLNPTPPRPRTNEPVSVHLLTGPVTVLFGTGFTSGFDRLSSELDAVGGPDVVVVEHGDPDHYDALPAILDRYDPLVAIPAADADVLTDIGITPDETLKDDEERWGIRTIHVPGHTPGNMSFLHEPTETLFAGDTVVHRNSFTAAPGEWSGELAPIKPSLNDDDRAARANIQRLADFDVERVLTTHGLNVFDHAERGIDRLIEDLERQ